MVGNELDVAFVDIRLPKLFGDAAVAQYRAWERDHCSHRPPLRIFATSGDATAAVVKQNEVCGFDGSLAKPVYPAVYRQVINGSSVAKMLGTDHEGSDSVGSNLAHFTGCDGSVASELAVLDTALSSEEPPDPVAALATSLLTALSPIVMQPQDLITKIGLPMYAAVGLLSKFEPYAEKAVMSMRIAESKDNWGLDESKDNWGLDNNEPTQSVCGIAHTCKAAALQISAVRLATMCERLYSEAKKHRKQNASTQALATLKAWHVTMQEVRDALSASEASYEEMFAQPTLAGESSKLRLHPKPADNDAVLANVRQAKTALREHFDQQMALFDAIEAAATRKDA